MFLKNVTNEFATQTSTLNRLDSKMSRIVFRYNNSHLGILSRRSALLKNKINQRKLLNSDGRTKVRLGLRSSHRWPVAEGYLRLSA